MIVRHAQHFAGFVDRLFQARLLDPELVAQESQRLQEVTTQPTLPGVEESAATQGGGGR